MIVFKEKYNSRILLISGVILLAGAVIGVSHFKITGVSAYLIVSFTSLYYLYMAIIYSKLIKICISDHSISFYKLHASAIDIEKSEIVIDEIEVIAQKGSYITFKLKKNGEISFKLKSMVLNCGNGIFEHMSSSSVASKLEERFLVGKK